MMMMITIFKKKRKIGIILFEAKNQIFFLLSLTMSGTLKANHVPTGIVS